MQICNVKLVTVYLRDSKTGAGLSIPKTPPGRGLWVSHTPPGLPCPQTPHGLLSPRTPPCLPSPQTPPGLPFPQTPPCQPSPQTPPGLGLPNPQTFPGLPSAQTPPGVPSPRISLDLACSQAPTGLSRSPLWGWANPEEQQLWQQAVVREVVEDLISPNQLGKKYGIAPQLIQSWVKKAGHALPKSYKR